MVSGAQPPRGRSRGRRSRVLRPPPAAEAARLELEHHVEELADRLEGEGLTRHAALVEARRRLGDSEAFRRELERMAEDVERRWTMRMGIDEFLGVVRALARRPGVPLGGGAMLAAAMTLVLTAWTVVDGVLYRPPPFPQPERVMQIFAQREDGSAIPGFTLEHAQAWLGTDLWSAAGMTRRLAVIRTDRTGPEEISAQGMTPGAFAALGVRAAEGRLFTEEDALEGATPVAVIPELAARSLRAGGPALGRTLVLDGQEVRVVGVLPRGVRYPMAFGSDVFLPMAEDGTVLGRPSTRVEIVGRIARDLEVSRARAATLVEGLRAQAREAPALSLRPIGEIRANPDVRRNMLLALGALGFLFLVTLVNAALLFVIQAASRGPEEGVRLSLGASRARLLRAWVLRGGIVGGLALIVALGAASALVGPILRTLPQTIGYMVPDALGLDGRAVGLVLALGALAWGGLSLLPALTLRWVRPAGAGGLRSTETRGAARLRGALVAVQVALSLLLVATAAVLGRSHHALASADFGFDADRVAFISVQMPSARYPEVSEVWATADALRERIAALPGVEGASITNGAPASAAFSFGLALQAEGREPLATSDRLLLPEVSVDEHAVDALGLTLVEGRGFTRADDGTDRVVIDEPLARALWPEGSAIGRRFRFSEDDSWLEVIGVVRDVRLFGPNDTNTPYDVLRYGSRNARPWATYVVARTSGDPRDLLPAMREAWLTLDRGVPPQSILTARMALAQDIHLERFVAALLLALAVATTAVAVLGLYGTVTYSVVRRVRELGIRTALGADAARIRRTVLAGGARTVAVGVALGLGAAVFALRLLDVVVYGVTPVDPVALVLAASAMFAVGLLACLVPAARAARTDPAVVLREG